MLNPLKVDLNLIVSTLSSICGEEYIFVEPKDLTPYKKDETLNLEFDFDILIKPKTAIEISQILKVCNQFGCPVTPRGGGTGVTGGALPIYGGVVLSLERMNEIISLNKVDGYIIVDAGVTTAELCHSVEKEGLYFPVFPGSGSRSFIGGNVAENAGSAKSCKYGVTSDYVLNLEVVLPDGEIIWTGSNVSKNVSGFDITSLFIGSEGVLGIVTKVVYRLLPIPLFQAAILVGFKDLKDACDCVIDIKGTHIFPSAVELICENAIDLTSQYLGGDLPMVSENISVHLLVNLEEFTLSELNTHLRSLNEIFSYRSVSIMVGRTSAERGKLSRLRDNIGNAMTGAAKYYRDIDCCLPLTSLYDYVRTVEQICSLNEIKLVCFGHALDGNLHTNLLFGGNVGEVKEDRLRNAVSAIYSYAISKGGVISGEHGIGYLQKEHFELFTSNLNLSLMKKIKRMLDPNAIMNPGKIF